jgi:hypothetical protein
MRLLPLIEKFTSWVTLESGVRVRYTRMEFNWDDFEDEEKFDANEVPTVFICIPGK